MSKEEKSTSDVIFQLTARLNYIDGKLESYVQTDALNTILIHFKAEFRREVDGKKNELIETALLREAALDKRLDTVESQLLEINQAVKNLSRAEVTAEVDEQVGEALAKEREVESHSMKKMRWIQIAGSAAGGGTLATIANAMIKGKFGG